MADYKTIERPYDDYIKRTADEIISGTPDISGPSGGNIESPNQVGDDVLSGKSVGDLWIGNFIKSRNYKPKSQGFYLDGKTGYAEFMNIYVVGSIVGSSIHIPDENATANSFHVESDADTWWGCTQSDWTADHDNATAYILNTGVAKFQNVTLTNSVIIQDLKPGSEISIQGWQFDGTFSSTDADTVSWTTGTLILLDSTTYTIDAGNTDNMVAVTYIYFDVTTPTIFKKTTNATTAVGSGKILIGVAKNSTTEAIFTVFGGSGGNKITGNDIENFSIGSGKTKPAIRGWQFDGTFSSTDADTVSWTTGTLKLSDETTSYTIATGNTDNMAVTTYIYLDVDTSTTAFQKTTTAINAVGDNKILIAVAYPGTNEALFQVFGGTGGLKITGVDIEDNTITATQILANTITANEIAANTITANEIAANTITATEIVAGTITANEIAAGTITANEIAANTILAANIAVGTITANEIAAGTILAINIAAGTITGNEIAANTIVTNNLSATAIDGMTITGSTIQTAASGSRVIMDISGIRAYTGATQRVSIASTGAGWFGSASGFAWDTAGNITLDQGTITGATFRTAATGARVVFDSTGIKAYDATTQRVQILSDGSGWFGSSTGLAWTAAGVLTAAGLTLQTGSTLGSTDVLTAESRANTLFQKLIFIGNYNDGLTETTAGASSITRRLLHTIIDADANHTSLTSGQICDGWDTDNEMVILMKTQTNVTQDIFIGLAPSGTTTIPADATSTVRHIAFMIQDGTLYASNGNNTTQTRTNVSSGITLTNWNYYRFVWDNGTNIKFYINDTLVATHTTNLPSTNGTPPAVLLGIINWSGGANQSIEIGSYVIDAPDA